MDSMIAGDQTLPINFDTSVNMSQFPDLSGFAPRLKSGRESHEPTTPRNDQGGFYPPALKVVGDKLSPVGGGGHMMKDYGTQISDLKKENFSLKLRIFYMEEQMQQQFDGDHEQLLRMNIELKVDCEGLRRELKDKNDLLVKASNAVASMDTAGPAEIRRARNDAEQEVLQLRELMNDKLQKAEKDLLSTKRDAEECLNEAIKLRSQLEEANQENRELNEHLEEEIKEKEQLQYQLQNAVPDKTSEDLNRKCSQLEDQVDTLNEDIKDKDSTITQLKESLNSKQTVIELMNDEKQNIVKQQVQPLLKEAENLRRLLKDTESKLKQSQAQEDDSQTAYQELLILQDDYQEHITEQQQRLNEFELATKQMSEELEKREVEVKDLKDALTEAEESSQQLRENFLEQSELLHQKDAQVKKDINKRDRAIAGLTQMLRKKEEEIESLNDEIRNHEMKEEEFLTSLSKLEKPKPSSSAKDSLINQLRTQLKDTDSALQDALDANMKHDDENQKLQRDLNNQLREKDRLIDSLQTQGVRERLDEKDEQIERLSDELKNRELKEEELLNALSKLDKPASTARDDLINHLRKQLKESDGALQDALDNNMKQDDEYQKLQRDLNNQLREKDRMMDSLQTQVYDAEETVSALDSQIKEKDEELQSLANKHKSLLREIKLKEEECMKALRERDELIAQCSVEKQRFTDLAKRSLRRASSDFGSGSSLVESDVESSKMRSLEQKLRMSEKSLSDANYARDLALNDLEQVRNELSRALESRESDSERSRRRIAQQDVRIHRLEEQLNDKEANIEDLEAQLRNEIDKLARINRELQSKLNDHENLSKSKKSLHTSEDEADATFQSADDHLQNTIDELNKKIAKKNKTIKELKKKRLTHHNYNTRFDESPSSDSVSSSEEIEEEHSFEYHTSYHYRPSRNQKSPKGESVHQSQTQTPRHVVIGPRQAALIAENAHPNHSNSTLGFIHDQTSYMSMPDAFRGSPQHDTSADDVGQILQDTRHELSCALRELAELKQSRSQLDYKLRELQESSNKLRKENQMLEEKLELADNEKMEKESEILGLLARIKDGGRTRSNKLTNGFNESEMSDDSMSMSSQSRAVSGDESDGMRSLKRRELCDVINNLKKKLANAEKVNGLLKNQLKIQKESSPTKLDETKGVDLNLVEQLSAEVERLKEKLKEQEQPERLHSGTSIPNSFKKSSTLMRSKLPLPKDKLGNLPPNGPLHQEMERARALNRKLNERLASTEATVRHQAEKLNKCRAALREAGIASPPMSPLRGARSVPNLFHPADFTIAPDFSQVDGGKRSRHSQDDSAHSETSDASTQTTQHNDSGVHDLSPKSQQKHSSLIQAQAKELSYMRQQLQKARSDVHSLDTEMDVLNRYVESLLLSFEDADPVLVEGVKGEIEHSRSLVRKLRQRLAANAGESSNTESESFDSSDSDAIQHDHNKQVKSLTTQLNERNSLISALQNRIDLMDEVRPTSQPLSTGTYTAGGWHSPQQVTSGQPQHAKHNLAAPANDPHLHLLTPSSHFSLKSAQEEELRLTQDESSRLPSAIGELEDRYADLPSSLERSPHRTSWPFAQGHEEPGKVKRRSMPMYQKTIAVTEYLPPTSKPRKEPRASGSSQDDMKLLIGRRRRIPTNTDETQCSAAFGGAWVGLTPRKSDASSGTPKKRSNNTSHLNGATSCEDEVGQHDHRMARELDRMRRRLSDSKRINRTLKDELDLATRSLQRVKESEIPGYQKSPQRTTDMIAQHLSEIRGLRQRLEQSIATNDLLRVKLEERLNQTDPKEHVSANIYLSPDPSHPSPPSPQIKRRLQHLEAENSKLIMRLAQHENNRNAFGNKSQQMNALEHRLMEKSSQTDLLAHHVDQLQSELHKQNQFSEHLRRELKSRDHQLNQLKHQVEKKENEKSDAAANLSKEREAAKRLQNELVSVENQLDEAKNLIDTLKSEVALHEKLNRTQSYNSDAGKFDSNLSELLVEIRSLRDQLERSIDTNSALRRQLEEQVRGGVGGGKSDLTTINIHHLSPLQRSGRGSLKSQPGSARRKLKMGQNLDQDSSALMTPPASASSGAEDHPSKFFPDQRLGDSPLSRIGAKSPERPLYCKGGPYTMCKSSDFASLQQNLIDSGILAQSVENKLAQTPTKLIPMDKKSKKDISKVVSSLIRHMSEGDRLLQLFWPVDLQPAKTSPQGRTTSFSSSGVATGGQCTCSGSESIGGTINARRDTDEFSNASEADGLRKEVGKLRQRLSTQDRLLQTTVERLHTTNRLKEGIESAIVKQLSRTHNVLRKARGNLEANVQQS